MNTHTVQRHWLAKLEAHPVITALFLAVVTRSLVLILGFQDFWGDSHHNLIMSRLTLVNDWAYSDFKDRHLTWLPAIRYWGAIVQWVTGTYSLQVMNVANSILGIATVGIGAHFATKLFENKWALYAGVILAIQPYSIVFSYMNMAEVLGALVVLGWFYGLHKQIPWVILITTFLAVLTRTELIYLVGITIIYLFVIGERKRAFWSAIGAGTGLILWFAYSWWATGNPLGWMLIRIGSTTSSTEFYTEDANLIIRYGLLPLFALLQAFPLIVFFIWLKKTAITFNEYSIQTLIGFFLLNHFIFFLLAQTTIISYPEARFFAIVLPIATIWFVWLMAHGYFRAFVDQRKVIVFLGFCLLQLIIPYYRQYSLQPRKEIGYWMKDNLREDTKIWSDLAVPIVESEIDPKAFISSFYLLDETPYQEGDAQRIARALISNEVEYVASYPEIFDYSTFLIPDLREFEPFEWQGITFVPVYKYEPYSMQKSSVHDYLRYRFEESTQPASIWRIYPK